MFFVTSLRAAYQKTLSWKPSEARCFFVFFIKYRMTAHNVFAIVD